MYIFNVCINLIGVVFSINIIGLGHLLVGGALLALNGGLLLYNAIKLQQTIEGE